MEDPELILMAIIGVTSVLSFLGSLYLKDLSSREEAQKIKESSAFKKRALPSVLFMIPLLFFALQIVTQNIQFFWIGIFALVVFFFWAIIEAAKIDIKMSMDRPSPVRKEIIEEKPIN